MKLIYCHCSLYNPGGMERVLLNKVRWLHEHTEHEIVIVTTDQKGRPPFYEFPQGVRIIDLGINYSDDNGKAAWKKIGGYLRKRRLHRKRLTKLLIQEKADIVISLYPSESSFIPKIKDGGRKVLELHFNKFFRLQYMRSGILGLIDRWRTGQDEKIVRRFDRFVVLTEEDRGYWGSLPNIEVIPNAAMSLSERVSDCSAKRVIAVGRLDYQKSFDRLIHAWEIVRRDSRSEGWRLDIFGQGEWEQMLGQMIEDRGLQDSAKVNPPTRHIAEEYLHSSMLVMSSHYEGFPMVMIEAMASGLPVVSFDFKCGPKDIINQGVNGLIVKDGDIEGVAGAMLSLMDDEGRRQAMGEKATEVTQRYSETRVMELWCKLFDSLR